MSLYQQPTYEGHFLSKMIDECWDKLKQDCISLDELKAFSEALALFPGIDTTEEQRAIQERVVFLLSNPLKAKEAEQRSCVYDHNAAIEDAAAQEDLSQYSEAEEATEGDEAEGDEDGDQEA